MFNYVHQLLFDFSVAETGDDITKCLNDRTLIIANHQSTADVPLLFACFNTKTDVLNNIMWIMDSLFKYTNFGIVSVMHKDFFIKSVRHYVKSVRTHAHIHYLYVS